MADSKVKFEETGNGDRPVRKWKNKWRKSKWFVRKHILEQVQWPQIFKKMARSEIQVKSYVHVCILNIVLHYII